MKKNMLDKYQVVVLKSPYDFVGERSAEEVFMDICRLKITGYSKEYPEGVLPLDSSDFIATHVALCEKTWHGLQPIMGFKAVSLSKCDYHRVNFPIFGMMKSAEDTSRHTEYFEKLVARYRAKGMAEKLAYNGSFTVHPDKRSDKEFMEDMWDLVFCLISAHYITEEIEHVVAVCATKFRVDQKKTTRGWDYITHQDQQLGKYHATSLYEAELIPMEMMDIKKRCTVEMRRFPELWENRMVLAKDMVRKKIAA